MELASAVAGPDFSNWPPQSRGSMWRFVLESIPIPRTVWNTLTKNPSLFQIQMFSVCGIIMKRFFTDAPHRCQVHSPTSWVPHANPDDPALQVLADRGSPKAVITPEGCSLKLPPTPPKKLPSGSNQGEASSAQEEGAGAHVAKLGLSEGFDAAYLWYPAAVNAFQTWLC